MDWWQAVGYTIAAAGIGIVTGYGIVAVAVAPNFRATTPLTRVGGVYFFLMCAAMHLEIAGHFLGGEPITVAELASLHMALIMVPQAVAVMAFLAGLHVDGLLPTTDARLARAAHHLFDVIARWRLLNRICRFLGRRLRRYATLYLIVTAVATVAGA